MGYSYIINANAPDGVEELTKSEWLALMGDETTGPYATCVYRGEITLDDVPEDIRTTVGNIVQAKIDRWGLYAERRVAEGKALSIIMGDRKDWHADEAAKVRAIIEQASASLDDQTASSAAMLFPAMRYDGALIKAGTRINWGGTIKRAAVDLWDTTENSPELAPALWEDIAYRDGWRIIPEVITAGTAFAMDEYGWWGDVLYRSMMAANVYTPEQYPAGWVQAD